MKKILFTLFSLVIPALGWASFQPVTGSTVVVQTPNNNTTAIPITSAGIGQPVTSTSTKVLGMSANAVAVSGNPVLMGVNVASITMPTADLDGTASWVMGDQIGRVSVTGIPYGLIVSTWNSSVSTTETVLVSTPAANQYVYLCGCYFTNSSVTNVAITFKSPTASTRQAVIGAPANYITSGIWPADLCSAPFFRGAVGSNVSITQNTTASSIAMNCTYYTGP